MSEEEKSYCYRCDHETNHSVLSKVNKRSDDEGHDFSIDYMIVKCMGCETISFREVFVDLESRRYIYEEVQGPDIYVYTYPKKPKVTRKIENSHILPETILPIYDEAIVAFNEGCYILTGVAFRIVIEAICIEKKVEGYTLEEKINNLVTQKLITEKEALRLHSVRFIGNDSAHGMKLQTEKELKIVLNIIDHLLNNLYLIDYDLKGTLETVITDFQDFEILLNNCIKKLNKGEEYALLKILDKSKRRLNGRVSLFENELIEKIESGKYTRLSLGKTATVGKKKEKVQYFIVNELPVSRFNNQLTSHSIDCTNEISSSRKNHLAR